MLKIRLRRMGSRHRPFYRVVVSDSRRTPTSAALDELGFYDPRRSPSVFKIDLEKVDAWIAKGAQPSDTLSRLVRKARKGEFAEAPAAEAPAAEAPAAEAKAEAPAAEEAPAEEAAEAKAEEASEAKAEEAKPAEATEAEEAEATEDAEDKAGA